MSEDNSKKAEAYVSFNPGDLITAESMNDMQIKIREDINNNVEVLSEELKKKPKETENADKFDGKKPDEWIKYLDNYYIAQSELDGDLGHYCRMYKQVTRLDEPIVVQHDLGRYPTVQLFSLETMLKSEDASGALTDDPKKFLVYYAGARDSAVSQLTTRADDVYYFGDPLQLILDNIELKVTNNQLFDDVLNDMWGKMFNPGGRASYFNFEKYGHTDYVQSSIVDARMTVQDLIKARQWEDLRLAVRPQVIPIDGTNTKVYHLSQKAIEVHLSGSNDDMDLMLILRT